MPWSTLSNAHQYVGVHICVAEFELIFRKLLVKINLTSQLREWPLISARVSFIHFGSFTEMSEF